jgi:hypothetical protein
MIELWLERRVGNFVVVILVMRMVQMTPVARMRDRAKEKVRHVGAAGSALTVRCATLAAGPAPHRASHPGS